ncbi:aspartate aminotransferase family protein [Amycolatopsis pigmentata]|uniref:Aspartate aminotransferase family protein n=1 Tax=Amycolatopsis pigmentata TaxID=450801 RepID=A0ABW5G690_9PSEU
MPENRSFSPAGRSATGWDPDTAGLISLAGAANLTAGQVRELYRRFVDGGQIRPMTSFGCGDSLTDRAEGVWLYTRDGRRILDFASGAAGFSHGHNHPSIVAARLRYAERRRMEVHKTYFSPYLAALGHNLATILPGDLCLSFFPNSAAEAIEGAVKLAYKYHGGTRNTILCSDIADHGRLLGSGSLSAGNKGRYPEIPGVARYHYDSTESVRSAITRATKSGNCDVYAILVEPFSSSTARQCSKQFLRDLRELCTAGKIVLIFDETRTGLGRTGSLFHFTRHPGLIPDVLAISRSFGGGKSSVSAYVARKRIFRQSYDNLADSLLHSTSTTYYGFGEENATAIEAIRIAVEHDYPRRARDIQDVLAPGLARIQRSCPGTISEIRGCGATFGVMLDYSDEVVKVAGKALPSGLTDNRDFVAKLTSAAVLDALYKNHGILAHQGLHGRLPVLIGPPLIAEPEHVERFLDGFEAALADGLPRLLTKFLGEKATTL